nr:hypothetical protein [uncultured Roseovarius sp.]
MAAAFVAPDRLARYQVREHFADSLVREQVFAQRRDDELIEGIHGDAHARACRLASAHLTRTAIVSVFSALAGRDRHA